MLLVSYMPLAHYMAGHGHLPQIGAYGSIRAPRDSARQSIDRQEQLERATPPPRRANSY